MFITSDASQKQNKTQNTEECLSTLKDPVSDQVFDMISNPAVHALQEGLRSLHKLQENESAADLVTQQLEVLGQIHMVLLMDNEQFRDRIIEIVGELLVFIKNGELYSTVCTILSDISHNNEKMVQMLLNKQIFGFLDYSKNISYALVFSICDNHGSAWLIFEQYIKEESKNNQYIKEESKNNQYIKMLIEQFKKQ